MEGGTILITFFSSLANAGLPFDPALEHSATDTLKDQFLFKILSGNLHDSMRLI